jgi:hypothetical protein
MGGVHLDAGRLVDIEKQLARELPNVTTIDVTAIARLTGKILGRLARVVNALSRSRSPGTSSRSPTTAAEVSVRHG